MLKVENVSFNYSTNKSVLKNINIILKKGEVLCLMGESGSGKSTFLKLIYGLLDASKGKIFWNNTPVLGPKDVLVPGFDKFKYVAQDFDLMPYTSVSENIKKFLSRFYPKESKKRTQELLEVIEMTAYANTKVKHLSGGQQQRVAIARALAKEPEMLLLDEPFSQIDNFKKNALRRSLFAYLKAKNIACIIATHDGNDALSFASKMIVIKDYNIVVNNTPKVIYNNPKSKYVASLFDDVNEIILENKTAFFYSHQIKVIEKSKYKATVLNAYFKGPYWLIESTLNGQSIFFNCATKLKKDQKVNLIFNKITI